jgi:hypothetical protein
MSIFNFFFRAERSKESLAGQSFDEYWASRPANDLSVELPEDTDLPAALKAALEAGMPKGSHRGGCFEVQGPRGIWKHSSERRLIGAVPSKIVFKSWVEIDAEEVEGEGSSSPSEKSDQVAEVFPSRFGSDE